MHSLVEICAETSKLFATWREARMRGQRASTPPSKLEQPLSSPKAKPWRLAASEWLSGQVLDRAGGLELPGDAIAVGSAQRSALGTRGRLVAELVAAGAATRVLLREAERRRGGRHEPMEERAVRMACMVERAELGVLGQAAGRSPSSLAASTRVGPSTWPRRAATSLPMAGARRGWLAGPLPGGAV